MSASSYFRGNVRSQIAAAYVTKGVDRQRARMITDLACDAADRSIAVLLDAMDVAPDDGAKFMAAQVAAQIAAAKLTELANGIRAYGQERGEPSSVAEVRL